MIERKKPRHARSAFCDEQGVSLIIVAVMILVLTGMTSFVLDYGVVWLGRRQAQNAADAGALAGVQALRKDDSSWTAGAALNPMTDGSANGVAQANSVLGETPGTEALAECPAWMTAPANTNCVEVNVYRDGTHGSTAMPVFFAKLLGQTSQNIRATATAQIIDANSSGCMRPWFMPERWVDVNKDGVYDDGDSLNPYDIPGDIGLPVTFNNKTAPSSYGTLDVGSGEDDIAKAIGHCVANKTFTIDGSLTTATEPGAGVGPKEAAIQNLLDWDKEATWDATKKEVVGGCSVTGTCVCDDKFKLPCPYGGTQSPRIVQAAICSPPSGDCVGTSGKGSITISNILSFFIVGCNGVAGTCKAKMGEINIDAILIGSAGLFDPAGGSGTGKSFVTVTMLVR